MKAKKTTMISIRDLASLAGYSPSTVSMALRDHPAIRISTKKKIQAIADEQGYKLNRLAEGIFSGKVRLVGVVANIDVDGAFNRPLVQIEKALRAHGYSCLMLNSHENIGEEKECFQAAIEHRVSGIIIQTVNYSAGEQHYIDLNRQDIPYVLISEYSPNVAVPHVHLNDDALFEEIVKYLIGLGHSSIAYIAGPKSKLLNQDLCYQGMEKGLSQVNIDPNNVPIVHADAWTIEAGYDAAKKLFENSNTKITAVITAIDTYAMGVITYAKEKGISIPDELSVTGTGDFAYSYLLSPPLTTTRRCPETIATKAVETLTSLMKLDSHAPIPSNLLDQVIPGELIIRDSTGPAPI